MGKKLILLVDDEDIVRLTTEEILKELGFEVVTASCAAEAIERLKDKAADIDLMLPNARQTCTTKQAIIKISMMTD